MPSASSIGRSPGRLPGSICLRSGRSRVTEGGLWVERRLLRRARRTARGRPVVHGGGRRAGLRPGAVISHAFWQREFGGDASVVGRTMPIDRRADRDHRCLAKPGFSGTRGRPIVRRGAADVRGRSVQPASVLDNGTRWWLTVMGRLGPGCVDRAASRTARRISPGHVRATSRRTIRPRASRNTGLHTRWRHRPGTACRCFASSTPIRCGSSSPSRASCC